MKTQVRTVFLGNAGCGKTSIINMINTDEFLEELPSVIEEVSIPDEFTPSHTPLLLNDTDVSASNIIERSELVSMADAIVLVLDASDEASYEDIFSNWMPSILKIDPTKPVIVVANKMDLIESDEANTRLEDMLGRILAKYMSVEVCLKCSAKTALNLDRILDYADKSVMFPIAPLYDRATHTLHKPLQCILRRIFRIFNRSRSLALSDEELNEFQYSCFGTRMSAVEITNLKQVLRQQGGEGCLDPATNGITEEGFLLLMQLFVMKEHTETVWMALRHCGYTDDLELTLLDALPPFQLKEGQSVEFTAEARVFLTSLFKAYDREKSGVLTQEGLCRVFSPIEDGKPLWDKLTSSHNQYMQPGCPMNCFSNENNDITLSGWISEWILMLHIAPEETISTIIQLGFDDDPSLLYIITHDKEEDWKKYQILRRNVIHAFLFGQTEVGKTTLLRRLLRAPQTALHVPTEQLYTVVAPVKPRTQKSDEKVVIMTEVPPMCEQHVIEECMDKCDIACLAFDASDADSFAYVQQIQRRLPQGMKVLYIANKSDKNKEYETTELCRTAASFLSECGLELPLLTNMTVKDRLFPIVFDCAVYPDICVPKCEVLQTRKSSMMWKFTALAMVLGLIAGGLFMYKKHH